MTDGSEDHVLDRRYCKIAQSSISCKEIRINYEQFRREAKNGHEARSKEQPFDAVEANLQIEYCNPQVSYQRNLGTTKQNRQGVRECSKIKEYGKVDSEEGEQHFSGDKKFPCFKCGRFKSDCSRVNKSKHKTKDDRSLVNTQALIDEKFAEMKESKKNRQRGSREVGGGIT